LSFDPVDGVAIALGALAAITKCGEAFDRGLVLFEIQSAHKGPDWVVGGRGNRRLLGVERSGGQ